jgi:ABC-type cobalt transport system substrate-binding protein
MNNERIIYSLNIIDVQNVANEKLNRGLDEEEMKLVENKLGDYIDWFAAISDTISGAIE